MKTIFIFFLMVLAVTVNAQLKVTQAIIYYKDASFTVSPLIPIATTNTAAVPWKQMQDAIAAAVSNAGMGTVTSVGSGLGLVGTVTSSGTLALDTANVNVLSRQRAANTFQLKGSGMVYPAAGIPLSGGSSWGTSITNNSANWNAAYSWGNHYGLYTPIAHDGATGSAHGTVSTSVNGFMSSTDKTKLDGIATGATANTGTVTSVTTGLGLSGGTISTSGTILVDTANVSVLSRERAANTYQAKLGFTPYNSTNPSGYTTNTGTVTSVTTGLGLSGGTISTSGTILVDTANVSVLSRQRAVNMYTPKSHVGSTGAAHGVSTTSVAGFMSSADKSKLDSLDSYPFIQKALKLLGSSVKMNPVFMTFNTVASYYSLGDNIAIFTVCYLARRDTLHGIKFSLNIKGVFTGDNYNGFGLFKLEGANYVKVAETANDENVWKQPIQTINTIAFTTPYIAEPGLYYVAALYCSSAQTTGPGISSSPSLDQSMSGIFPTLNYFSFYISPSTSLLNSYANTSAMKIQVIPNIMTY